MGVLVDGQMVNIGDHVCFKCDIEQSGVLIGVKKTYAGTSLTLQNLAGFSGDYIGGETVHTELASDCWL
jgi:hypothetical protein